MQIGDLKVADAVLNLELQVNVLNQVVNYLINQNKDSLQHPNQKTIESFKEIAIQQLQVKYPNMGIKKNS